MSEKEEKLKIPEVLPVLPIKDAVIFPAAMLFILSLVVFTMARSIA